MSAGRAYTANAFVRRFSFHRFLASIFVNDFLRPDGVEHYVRFSVGLESTDARRCRRTAARENVVDAR